VKKFGLKSKEKKKVVENLIRSSFMFVLATGYYEGYQMKEDKLDQACSHMHGTEKNS
jgi:hypothetical protein